MPRPRSRLRERAINRRLSVPEPKAASLRYIRDLERRLNEAEPKVIALTKRSDLFRSDALSVTATIEAMDAFLDGVFAPGGLRQLTRLIFGMIEVENWRFNSRILSIPISKRGTGIDRARREFIAENVELTESIPDKVREQLAALIREGTEGQIRHEELAVKIAERFNVGRSRARLIARDQTLKHNARLTRTRHQAIGINTYRWSTSRDERVRPAHAGVNGQIFQYDHPPLLSNGFQGNPGEDIQCRCVAVPVLPGRPRRR